MKTKIILSAINLLSIFYLIAIGGASVFQDKITATEQEILTFIIVAPLVACLVTVFMILAIFSAQDQNERNDNNKINK